MSPGYASQPYQRGALQSRVQLFRGQLEQVLVLPLGHVEFPAGHEHVAPHQHRRELDFAPAVFGGGIDQLVHQVQRTAPVSQLLLDPGLEQRHLSPPRVIAGHSPLV